MSAGQPAAQLGVLQQAVDAETPFGGRDRTWTTVASLWVRLSVTGVSFDRSVDDQPPTRIETAAAAARDHPDAAPGQRLSLNGAAWRVRAVQRPAPGRMVLLLDRLG